MNLLIFRGEAGLDEYLELKTITIKVRDFFNMI